MQKLDGDGRAFLHAGGTVVTKKLEGETLRVDTGCIVAFSEGLDYDIERAGNLKSMFFGGEGMFRRRSVGLICAAPESAIFATRGIESGKRAVWRAGTKKGEGSAIGSIYRMLDGR